MNYLKLISANLLIATHTGHKLTLQSSLLRGRTIVNLAVHNKFRRQSSLSHSLNPAAVNLRLFKSTRFQESVFAAVRNFCSDSKTEPDPEAAPYEDAKIQDKPESALSTLQVPEHWPQLPVIAINRNPVFPKFIKIIEITDPQLMNLIRRKVRLNQPYAGVFMKKDETNDKDIVTSINDLHPVGTFVQIHECQDLGECLFCLLFNYCQPSNCKSNRSASLSR